MWAQVAVSQGFRLLSYFPIQSSPFSTLLKKKIKVVKAVSDELDLINVSPVRKRIEEENGKFHFVISRAVTRFPEFVNLARKNVSKAGNNSLDNGILYLKGGDLSDELSFFQGKVTVWQIRDFFKESFFETKVIVYLPV